MTKTRTAHKLQALKLADATEAEFQSAVIAEARANGWRFTHSRPAQNRSGKWSTPITGNKGWPDLILAREGRLIAWELKSRKGRLSPDQKIWLRLLDSVASMLPDGVFIVDVIRPADWLAVVEALEQPRPSCD